MYMCILYIIRHSTAYLLDADIADWMSISMFCIDYIGKMNSKIIA